MWSDEAYPQRRSLRLRDYDYASAGAYFVTICVANRSCLLGDIVQGAMHLNTFGQAVAKTWLDLPDRFPTVELDAFVVMPNHFHGIIMLNDIPALPASQGSVGRSLLRPWRLHLKTQKQRAMQASPLQVGWSCPQRWGA